MLIFRLSSAAAMSNIDRGRLREPEQAIDTFHIHKKSENNHPEVGSKQTQVPPRVFVTPAHLVVSRWLVSRTIERRPLTIDRVASLGCDREVTAAPLSSVRKHRSAQQWDGLLRSCRRRTLVNRGTCSAPQRDKWRVQQWAEQRSVTCCDSLLLAAGFHAAIRMNSPRISGVVDVVLDAVKSWGNSSIRGS